MDMIARRIQMIELTCRDRIAVGSGAPVGGGPISDRFNDTHMYMGGGRPRTGSCALLWGDRRTFVPELVALPSTQSTPGGPWRFLHGRNVK